MAAVLKRRALPSIEGLIFLLGVACLVWASGTWASAWTYQFYARRQLDQLLALPAAAEAAGRLAESAPAHVESLVGLLEIPRLDVSAAVLEGDDDRTLTLAVGHLPDTALPWEDGNTALAGHRDSFFRPIEQVRVGDEMRLATRRGEFRYRVRHLAIVEPDDVWVLNPSEHVGLTLITCYPFRYVGAAPKRYIVQAERLPAVP
jgi:sortase A